MDKFENIMLNEKQQKEYDQLLKNRKILKLEMSNFLLYKNMLDSRIERRKNKRVIIGNKEMLCAFFNN